MNAETSVVDLASHHRINHGRNLTQAEWGRLLAEPCGLCGESYHRYCDHDPEHDWNGVACINSMREHIEVLERALAATIATKEH